MADETSATDDKKSNKGCYLLIARIIAFIAAVYLLQWILQLAFNGQDSNEIAVALKPFQNHYLSFSKNFVTTEGSSGEFTDDMTGAGRFIWHLVFLGAVWLIVVVIIFVIPPLKRSFTVIFWIGTVIVTGIVFYWAFFVPYTKTIFTNSEMVIERTEFIFSPKTARIPFSSIEKFEYDFHEDQEIHTGHQLYSQIFATIAGKKILICENQISIETSDAKPTRFQKREAKSAVEALTKLIGR